MSATPILHRRQEARLTVARWASNHWVVVAIELDDEKILRALHDAMAAHSLSGACGYCRDQKARLGLDHSLLARGPCSQLLFHTILLPTNFKTKMPVNQFDDKKANLKTLISSIGAKEVDCRVRLTIHNVSNIPVLSGAYRVRWKFRDIDSKAAKQNHKKEQDRLTTLSVPSITASDVESTSSRNSIATITGLSDSSGLLQSSQPSESGVSVAPAAVNISADERGYTHYRHLRARDHTVTFDHAIDVVARLRIVKGELIGEPLKLVVERVRHPALTVPRCLLAEPISLF
jgi:hypothetical protein